MTAETDDLTDAQRALIGKRSPRTEATHAVEASEVRRFLQATMNSLPVYDPSGSDRYGGPVAPPAFPVHAFRPDPGRPDVLDQMDDPDFDGLRRDQRSGLPPVPTEYKRLLNGGYEYEIHALARYGDRIFRQSEYVDIAHKVGRSGPMLIYRVRDTYTNQDDQPLLTVIATTILR